MDRGVAIDVGKDARGKRVSLRWRPAPAGPVRLVRPFQWPRTEPLFLLRIGRSAWQPPGVRGPG